MSHDDKNFEAWLASRSGLRLDRLETLIAREAWQAACSTQSADQPTFEQIRDAIAERMGGHTVPASVAVEWTRFLHLLKLVKPEECALPRTPSSALPQEDRTRIADANLNALLTYTGGFYSVAMEHGMKRGETANAIAHVESAARALHRLAITPNSATSPTKEEKS